MVGLRIEHCSERPIIECLPVDPSVLFRRPVRSVQSKLREKLDSCVTRLSNQVIISTASGVFSIAEDSDFSDVRLSSTNWC